MTQSSSPAGTWDVSRKIKLSLPIQGDDAQVVSRAIEALDGVKAISLDQGKQLLEIHYSAAVIDYSTLVANLQKCGFPTANTMWSRLKGNWYQFTDTNSRENANLPPPACCNKAPKRR